MKKHVYNRYTYTYTHTQIHIYTCIYIQSYAYTCTHTHTHPHKHTHTHEQVHTHLHIYKQTYIIINYQMTNVKIGVIVCCGLHLQRLLVYVVVWVGGFRGLEY